MVIDVLPLQELDVLANELQAKKTKLLNKHQLVHQSSEEDTVTSSPSLKARWVRKVYMYLVFIKSVDSNFRAF